ncbi:uncharacterized protein LOC134811548 isoform X2 [Bolinopsis microptera]|uniref:uncharacterized protein LOC134811548 isoform X2 n=1 Tax=Bolinopsis microptera TaxID=2820187 RepID=UPI003078ADB6
MHRDVVIQCVGQSPTNLVSHFSANIMFLLVFLPLLIPLGDTADLVPQRPPDISMSTRPQTSTQSPPTTKSPKVSWFMKNYTANFTGPPTHTKPPPDKQHVSASFSYSFQGFLSMVVDFSSTPPLTVGPTDGTGWIDNTTGKEDSSSDSSTTYNGVTTSTGDEADTKGAVTLIPGDRSPGTGDRTTRYMDSKDGDIENSTTVCVFGEADPRVVDVVVYLTVDLVISVLALILSGTQLVIWYRTKEARLTNRSRLEGAWHVTYCTCCLVVLVTSSLYWIGAKLTFPLDFLLLCTHLLRTKAAQLLVAKMLLSWKKISCFAGTLLFLLDIAWFSLSFSLTAIMMDGCQFCQRTLLSRDCLANNIVDFIGVCGGTVVYCGVKFCGLLADKIQHSRKLYSQIPKNSTYLVNHSNGRVINGETNVQLKSKRWQNSISRVSMLFSVCHQVLSCLFIFGIFPSDF